MKIYSIDRHPDCGTWLIFRHNRIYAFRQTRQEAREVVRQEKALDAEMERQSKAQQNSIFTVELP